MGSGMDFKAGEVLSFDKPLGWTSFQLVGRVRGALCRKLGVKKLKVGHAGTLDPLATGVMIVCTGKATKRIDALQQGVKEYEATLRLGATTPSYDLEKPIDACYPYEHVTEAQVRQVLARFEGEIDQVPPVFSAVKVDGRRAYQYARQGEEVEMRPKRIRIESIELLAFRLPEIDIRVRCGKGTYIRSLARDIGAALDSGAHLTALRRTRVGDVRVEQCMTYESFLQKLEEWTLTESNETETR